MYRFILPVALGSLAISWATPQLINLNEVDAAPDPVLVTPPLDVQQNVPTSVAPASITPITTLAAKRDLGLEKRDGDCSPQPSGSGPVPNPDTASAFAADPDYAASATNAPTPDGYAIVFSNLNGSLSASNYMGLYTLTSFDTLSCASRCDQASGCQAFNVYVERDPSVDPNAQNCPNPPSTINYKCTLWGAPVAAGEATNYGQWRDSFQVLIAGSNAYNKNAPPPAINGYSGPTELGGAINAPLDAQGHNTYMGDQYFPFSQSQGYDPQTCANACNAQTTYDSQHPASDGTYQSCTFFNAYVLSENGVPQGLYCSFYNQTWAPSYATNYGQYRGSDRYTVSRSYSYTLDSVTTTTTAATSSISSTSSTSSTSSIISTSSTSSTSSATSTSSTTNYSPGCTPTATNLVQNGGFECGGLTSWTATDVTNTFHTLTIGDNSANAFEFLQEGPVSSSASQNPASLSQQLNGLVVGASYTVSYSVYFDKCTTSEGFVGTRFPGYSGGFTYDACDNGQAAVGKYADTSFVFKAGATTEQLRFEFVVGSPNAVIRLDNIAVTPA